MIFPYPDVDPGKWAQNSKQKHIDSWQIGKITLFCFGLFITLMTLSGYLGAACAAGWTNPLTLKIVSLLWGVGLSLLVLAYLTHNKEQKLRME